MATRGAPVQRRLDELTLLFEISQILDRTMPAGAHQLSWEARDDNGLPLTSGVYYYVLAAGNKVSWKKMILLR